MDGIPILLLIACVCLKTTYGCNINACLNNNNLLMPQSCQGHTTMLQCLKREYDGCTNHVAKMHLMMTIQMAMKSGVYCGYDMNQMTHMMNARAGLMTSLMNGTNGMAPMMMGGPFGMGGDDGPFDDGPFDDGPFDDGPFDDGPFDDGPFDDMGENGMVPMLAAPGGAVGATDTPPQAPGMLPSFRGGSMMQTNGDKDSGSSQHVQSWSALTIVSLLLFCVLNGM